MRKWMFLSFTLGPCVHHTHKHQPDGIHTEIVSPKRYKKINFIFKSDNRCISLTDHILKIMILTLSQQLKNKRNILTPTRFLLNQYASSLEMEINARLLTKQMQLRWTDEFLFEIQIYQNWLQLLQSLQ